MRIIGGKDYYDSARAFGEDRETVFVRGNHEKAELFQIPVVLTGDLDISYNYRKPAKAYSPDDFNTVTVILAGVVYRGMSYEERFKPGERVYIWSLDDYQTRKPFSELQLSSRDEKWFYKVNKVFRVWEDTIDSYFEPVKLNGDALDWIITNRVSVAIHDESWNVPRESVYDWKVNTDGLKDIGFQKAVDPYACFQELSMFVGGVLPRNGNPMVEITDNKMKIEKAGFDNKASFRHPV